MERIISAIADELEVAEMGDSIAAVDGGALKAQIIAGGSALDGLHAGEGVMLAGLPAGAGNVDRHGLIRIALDGDLRGHFCGSA